MRENLAEYIEAYAAAKSTGNQILIQFAGTKLQEILNSMPEDWDKKGE